MEMLSSKLHTAITALAAAAAALSGTGVTGVAAAAPVKQVGVTTQVRPVAKVTAAEVKSAGSAGIKGYGDDTCQSLANDYNTAVNASAEGLIAGDAERAGQNGQLANRIYQQLTDNCLVVD
jgi:hypothetical protein